MSTIIPTTRKNYQSVNTSCKIDLSQLGASGQKEYIVVNGLNTQGVRKVKNFSISLNGYWKTQGLGTPSPLTYLLVYIPSGITTPTVPNPSSDPSELYPANQYVILQGNFNSKKPKLSSNKLARNLNSGDEIKLIIKNPVSSAQAGEILVNINYAIAYN